ncbi:hypothetical protein GCM10010116_51630 [Microbispora rosea subsp. aerata]|nr:hypothetical protein [Microbispora rosea]GGO25727.1 hypothetical protein GCM10010116_51630 [Microbispora rosea subsp. aerata]GIH56906.1 hypothetical protein Mro02_38200 [Microbispora rosea subsp. aerata]GLJ82832.1 hypothetical protein GCM10017588_15580 [Microbispora rosea subsp. aerata]
MSISPITTLYLNEELAHDRIRTLQEEAAQERLASRIRSVQKARRQAERASRRLRSALARI